MITCKHYKLGFDIWAFIPAPNDILRAESATPVVDTIASFLQYMTVPPCLALIRYDADRKNLPAAILATGFAICHLIFAIVNFILL